MHGVDANAMQTVRSLPLLRVCGFVKVYLLEGLYHMMQDVRDRLSTGLAGKIEPVKVGQRALASVRNVQLDHEHAPPN